MRPLTASAKWAPPALIGFLNRALQVGYSPWLTDICIGFHKTPKAGQYPLRSWLANWSAVALNTARDTHMETDRPTAHQAPEWGHLKAWFRRARWNLWIQSWLHSSVQCVRIFSTISVGLEEELDSVGRTQDG
jgi:hypothetical protein